MKKFAENHPTTTIGLSYIIVVLIACVLLSSCGSARYYDVGTGQTMKKHCTGAWVR